MTATGAPNSADPRPREGARSPRTTKGSRAAWGSGMSGVAIGAELALVCVHLVVAAGFARLFNDSSFLVPIVGLVLVAHGTAVVARASGASVFVTVVGAFASLAIAVTNLLFVETSWLGLPSSATLGAASTAITEARTAFPVVVAPTDPLDGFVLTGALTLWVACWFADWSVHRLDATGEAITPAGAVFVFCAVLGSGEHQGVSAIAFAASALAFVGLQRNLNERRSHSLSANARRASAATLRYGAILGLVAILLGAVVAPRLPGSSSEATLDWRGTRSAPASRVTVSPMVELRRRLVEQSDLEVFRVRSNKAAYWRLTSLDSFDGEVWTSNGRFRGTGSELSSSEPPDQNVEVSQSFRISGLSTLWVPAAFEASSVESSSGELRWDDESSTLIVSGDQSDSNGLSYTVLSRVGSHSPQTLRGAEDTDPTNIAERYEALPTSFPAEVTALTEQITSSASTRYDKAMALQNYFRENFDYSTQVSSGHGEDALLEFLSDRVGYCEQFAGAFAVMARAIGIPARVAVGFTPGDQDPQDPTLFVVNGKHAHAWPEIYFPEQGWVSFEPTPGRGIPGAEQYTGVEPTQDLLRSNGENSTESPTTTESESPTTTTVDTSADSPTTTVPSGPTISASNLNPEAPALSGQDTQQDKTWMLPVSLSLALLAATLVWMLRRRYVNNTADPEPDGPIAETWSTLTTRIATVGISPASSNETPNEYVLRVCEDRRWPDSDATRAALSELAKLLDAERWSPASSTQDPSGPDATQRDATHQRALDLAEVVRVQIQELQTAQLVPT